MPSDFFYVFQGQTTTSQNVVPFDAISFQDALESILTWLLDAKDTLSKLEPVSSDVQIVKEQFQEHEV